MWPRGEEATLVRATLFDTRIEHVSEEIAMAVSSVKAAALVWCAHTKNFENIAPQSRSDVAGTNSYVDTVHR